MTDQGPDRIAKRPIVVYGAIAGNGVIAIAKFVAASLTGSSAMIAEGIHSLTDTGNELLLLLGIHRSRKPPDELHPFGYGKELYFWSLVVALLLFGLGGGMAFYEGIRHLLHPRALENPLASYVVLGVAAIAEGVSWTLALRELARGKKPTDGWSRAVTRSKDPSTFVVLLEDTAALAGIAVAAVGVAFTHALKQPAIDGVASMLIGVIIASVAVFLARECRALLLGESADRDVVKGIRRAIEDAADLHVRRLLTMQMAPDQVLVNVDVAFPETLSSVEVAAAVDALEQRVRQSHPTVRQVFVEVSGTLEAQRREERLERLEP